MKIVITSSTKGNVLSLFAVFILTLFFLFLCAPGCRKENERILSPSILPEKEYIRIPTDSALLHQVYFIRFAPPLYPKQFLKSKQRPSPHLFIKIDKYGYVDRVRIIESPGQQVSKAILKVARKWVFQLPDENPKPGPYHFTSRLYYSPYKKKYRGFNLVPSFYITQLIRKPLPVYAEKAARKKLHDIIVIDGFTDIYGRIVKIKVKQGKHKILIDAAKYAVSRRIYEPYIISGVPPPLLFTYVVQFPGKKKNFGTITEYLKIIVTSPQPAYQPENKKEIITKGEKSTIFTYFPGGSKKYEESFNKGVQHGSFQGWYRDGSKRIRGEFYNGLRSGVWTRWYENGNKIKVSQYDLSGKKHGKMLTWWDEKGKLKQSISFKNGLLHGKWFQWDRNGQKRFAGEYNQGTWLNGSWWTASGRLLLKIDGSETSYVNYNHVSFHDKGRSNPYYKDKPFTGTIIHFDDGVLLHMGEFKEGKRHGKYIRWDEHGNIVEKTKY